MNRIWHVLLLTAVLLSGPSFGTGCAARHREQIQPIERQEAAPMRPADSLDEEKSFSDRIGEVGVVLLVVLVAVGGIVVPVIFLL